MTTVNVTETVAAPAVDVWRIISDFAGIEPNEMIAGCAVEGVYKGDLQRVRGKLGV